MRITPLKVASLLLASAVILWIVGYTNGVGACSVSYKTETVNGASLTGFVEHGDTVRVAFGYYDCGTVKRGDVVIYNDASDRNPLIKIVRGVEGDAFMLALTEGGAKIFINGEALQTTTGQVYRISEDAYQLLALYEQDYGGVIPKDAVLILGNLPRGSRDSTQFGFVGVGSLLGKVVDIRPTGAR